MFSDTILAIRTWLILRLAGREAFLINVHYRAGKREVDQAFRPAHPGGRLHICGSYLEMVPFPYGKETIKDGGK